MKRYATNSWSLALDWIWRFDQLANLLNASNGTAYTAQRHAPERARLTTRQSKSKNFDTIRDPVAVDLREEEGEETIRLQICAFNHLFVHYS